MFLSYVSFSFLSNDPLLLKDDILKLLAVIVPSSCLLISSVYTNALNIADSMSVWNLLREFRIRKVHMAVVLNEYGGTVGVSVSLFLRTLKA